MKLNTRMIINLILAFIVLFILMGCKVIERYTEDPMPEVQEDPMPDAQEDPMPEAQEDPVPEAQEEPVPMNDKMDVDLDVPEIKMPPAKIGELGYYNFAKVMYF